MEIVLKNGETIILEITPLIFEYIEEYEGGLEQLKKDAKLSNDEKTSTKYMYATNHLIYSVIASNYDKPLTYRQAVKLVRIEDMEKIIKFIAENIERPREEMKEKSTKFLHKF